jgi:transcriptional regulator with XRE-family HTH domain
MTHLEIYRRLRDWSQSDLARELGDGFTASAISLLESQRLKPSSRQMATLRDFFGVRAEQMLTPFEEPVSPGRS